MAIAAIAELASKDESAQSERKKRRSNFCPGDARATQ
jgi:hypothetical protein